MPAAGDDQDIEIAAIVKEVGDLAATSGRTDLHARLVQTRRRLDDPAIHVIVVGEFKQGKSQLINALVNAPVCPVDDDVATAVPTVVKYAATTEAAIVREFGDIGRPHHQVRRQHGDRRSAGGRRRGPPER